METKETQHKVIMLPAYMGEGAIFQETIENKFIRNFYENMTWKDCAYFDLFEIVKGQKLVAGDWVTDGENVFKVEYNESTGYRVMRNNVGYGDYDYHTLEREYWKIVNSSNKYLNLSGFDNEFIEEFCEQKNKQT